MPHPMIVLATAVSLLATAPAALGQVKPPTPAAGAALPRAQFITDMEREFRKMDADKNGQLARAEIEQYQKLQAVAQAQARNGAMFAQLDTDKNGQLSKSEFAKIATPAPTANAQPMLDRMDGNRDNQVSQVEHRTATLANFDHLDANKDGVVNSAEMKAAGIKPR